MKMPKKTVAEFEDMLEYLQNVTYRARKGDTAELETVDYKFAQDVLSAAEEPLRKLGMYEAAEHTVKESKRLILAGEFDAAEQLILTTVREMMEKSGSNDRLRKLYAREASKQKQ